MTRNKSTTTDDDVWPEGPIPFEVSEHDFALDDDVDAQPDYTAEETVVMPDEVEEATE
ncbi:hypothetical protein ACOCJ5_10340 [Knoellia sp. CPCC 206450]|uniref:hypothetical protein n=1 Tax=Knoellia tibetensis TaxID=3404798 RepID=UPI003B4319D9